MTGVTGWCLHGRHTRCSHNPSGPCFGGVVLTNGQIFGCGCDCHQVGGVQLDLFGNTLVHTGFEVLTDGKISRPRRSVNCPGSGRLTYEREST